MLNTECTVLFQPSMFNTDFMPSKSVLAENCVCLCKQLCRCYSDRPKNTNYLQSKISQNKSSQVQRNGEMGHFSDPVYVCMYVCMYVCGWVCMVFGIISRTKARSATNEVPNCRSPERALLRHHIIGVRLLTSALRAKLPK